MTRSPGRLRCRSPSPGCGRCSTRPDRARCRWRTPLPGYRLAVTAEEVDAWVFEDLATQALSARTPADRLLLATRASELWTGEPYAECRSASLQAGAAALVELHVTVQEVRAEALLALGHPAAAARLLAPVAPDHPYREQLWALLARAQYACARQADALATLATLRTRLAEDLGVDPSSAVRSTEQAILTQDAGLTTVPAQRAAHRRTVRVVGRCRAVSGGYVVAHTPVSPAPDDGHNDRVTQKSTQRFSWFESPADAEKRLADVGYLSDAATSTTTYLAGALEKPLLVEGPAGVGKTELAKAVARATGAELVRLQCYEGLDEARALYEWNYKKQLLRIQAAGDQSWDETHDDIFTDEFLLTRPLLTAIRREEPTVLLIDEVDKTDVEVEGLLLEVLSDFQVTIPEMGTVAATRRPLVVLTSNATRELSEAIKRRCLFLHIDYPEAERERDIVVSQVPEVEEKLAGQIVEVVGKLRDMELRKAPSIAETIDWARTLVALGTGTLDEKAIDQTLGVVLKHASDHERAVRELRLRSDEVPTRSCDPPRPAHRVRRGVAQRRAPGLPRRGTRGGRGDRGPGSG